VLVPVAPGPAALPHTWIQDVLKDARQVAHLLRTVGAGAAADILEQGIRHASDIGAILLNAGL
jgi:hypothetical protein